MTQQVLWQCFGVNIARAKRTKVNARAEAHIGPDRFSEGLKMPQLKVRAEQEEDKVIVKTHDLPEGPEPAIVIVRDGRAVLSSFARHQTEIAQKPTTLEDAITSEKRSWSEHVDAWLDASVNKVFLRYEDLRVGDPKALERLSDFIGVKQIAPFQSAVEQMRAARPLHVQYATNGPGIEEVEREHGDLFWSIHGRAMERLGYSREVSETAKLPDLNAPR